MATFEADLDYFPRIRGRYVVYLRTSLRAHTKLDPNAQRDAVKALLSRGRVQHFGDFEEVEPLSVGARPELEKAIVHCREQNATLVIGKFDQMRGGRRWLEIIWEHGVKVRAADLPRWTYADFSRFRDQDKQRCREVGQKVRLALAEARSRGVPLGGERAESWGLQKGPAASAKSRSKMALRRDQQTMCTIQLIKQHGTRSLLGIANQLNQMGHNAPRGGQWSAAQVWRVIRKFADEADS